MIRPLIYKIHNRRLYIRWGLNQEWKDTGKTVNGDRITPITQSFAANDAPFYGELGLKGHNGIDFIAPNNSCLYAPEDGEVIYVGTYSDGCRALHMQSENFIHVFLHLQEQLVSVGQKIKQGDFISLTDNSGKYTTAPHSHWGTKPLNPDLNNGYSGFINQRGMIENLDVLKSPYEEGQCLLVKPLGRFYVVENGDFVFYDSEKNPVTRHIPIVDFFIEKNKSGLPKGFIKVVEDEQFNKFNYLIK